MKIFISGKILGDPNYRAKFEAARIALIQDGHTVITPSVLPGGMANSDYMRICLAMIDSSDAVYFLADYEESQGARLEWQYCKYTNKKTAFQIRPGRDGA